VSLVFGYAAGRGPGSRSGMRVHDDGRVELLEPRSDWREIAVMTPEEVAELAERTRAAGIVDLPPEVPRPDTMRGGDDCELRTDLDGRSLRSVVHGWSEENPPAQPSLDLVLALSALVSAAQARGAQPS
jgi:hypothetical protein